MSKAGIQPEQEQIERRLELGEGDVVEEGEARGGSFVGRRRHCRSVGSYRDSGRAGRGEVWLLAAGRRPSSRSRRRRRKDPHRFLEVLNCLILKEIFYNFAHKGLFLICAF